MPTHTDICIINPWTPLQPVTEHYLLLSLQENLQRASLLICQEMGVANHCLSTVERSRIISNLSLSVRRELKSLKMVITS